MNDRATDIARDMIREHEGYKRFPYRCTEGKITIGIGRNLEDRGLSDAEIDLLFQNDLSIARADLDRYSYFDRLDDVRQAALLDMSFQLGASRLAGFRKMHAALEAGDYATAAAECLDSRYATQVPNRARRIADMIRNGDDT
jgi:lysozyme